MSITSFSNHSYYKMSARNITKNEIKICLLFGEVIHKTGIKFHFLSKKKVIENNLSEKLEGLCVLVSRDESVITVYKNKNAISQTKRLRKENLKKFSFKNNN